MVIPADLGALSPAEQQVWDAYPRGTRVVLADAPDVRAEVVRSLLLGAREPEPGHSAALRVHGARVTGKLDLYQADVDSALEITGSTFDEVPEFWFARMRGVSFQGSTLPGLEAFGAAVQGTFNLGNCTFTGAVVIYGVQVSGDLDLDDARLTADDRAVGVFNRVAALYGDAVQIGRNVYLQGTTVDGDVELTGAKVGGTIHGRRRLRIEGGLRLRRAEVTGDIALTDATLRNPDGVALDAKGLRAGRLSLLAEAIEGTVDLRQARVEVFRDQPDRWPARLRLDNFRYAALEWVGRPEERLAWLARDLDGYRPQPYEQLAAFYRQSGAEAAARTVSLAKQRRRRQRLSVAGQAWGVLQDVLVGYGYRPALAALWLLALTLLGAVVFAIHPPGPGPAGRTFHPLVYSLDVLIPIIDFGQQKDFGIGGPAQWLAYVLTAMGWILFTAVAAALTRTFNRN